MVTFLPSFTYILYTGKINYLSSGEYHKINKIKDNKIKMATIIESSVKIVLLKITLRWR